MFMSVPYFVLGFFQGQISAASDTAARLYRENTPKALKSAPKIWKAMTKTQNRLIKTIRSRNFEKYIFVAYKDNGDDFFHKVPLLSQFIHFLSRCFIHVGQLQAKVDQSRQESIVHSVHVSPCL
jgi:hypothetical protein